VKNGIPKQIQNILTEDETVEKSFNLKDCRVYTTETRLLVIKGRTIQDFDYTHIPSIAYTLKPCWWLVILGIIIVIAGVSFAVVTDETIIWAIAGIGGLLTLWGFIKKSEQAEVYVVGVSKQTFRGSRDDLDSLLKIVRQKQATKQTVYKAETGQD